MSRFRVILFWLHLAAGLLAGVVILVMCATGTALAFESEIVAWAERGARQVAGPANGQGRLPLAELQRRLDATQPAFRGTTLTLRNDPRAAVTFSAGREGGYYANPYTGEIRQPATRRTQAFMELMLQWHRHLGRDGDQRPVGKAINGACNLAFCFLALSGLYLWMPRRWSWRSVKAVALIDGKISGKARDFNWHNAIGLWSAPILIGLTLTAVPISYRWGSSLVYRMVGEQPPVPGAPAAPAVELARPTPEARPLGYDALLAGVQQDFPHWETISFRHNAPREPGARALPPVIVTIREPGTWPRTATTTLTLNPFNGQELKREGFRDFSPGRQLRTWTRFLHTGQALGWGGQLVAGLACLGGCFLVYTGFALSWRRFFKKQSTPAA